MQLADPAAAAVPAGQTEHTVFDVAVQPPPPPLLKPSAHAAQGAHGEKPVALHVEPAKQRPRLSHMSREAATSAAEEPFAAGQALQAAAPAELK